MVSAEIQARSFLCKSDVTGKSPNLVQAEGYVVDKAGVDVDEKEDVFVLRPERDEDGRVEVSTKEVTTGRAEVTDGIVTFGPAAKGIWCGIA